MPIQYIPQISKVFFQRLQFIFFGTLSDVEAYDFSGWENPSTSLRVPILKLAKGLMWNVIFIMGLMAPRILFAESLTTLNPLLLEDNVEAYRLGHYLELLKEDPQQEWGFDQIRSPEISQRFIRSTQDIPQFGGSVTYWVRVSLKNSSDSSKKWLLELSFPAIRHLQFYIPNADGSYRHQTIGSQHPMSHRDFDHYNFIFNVETPPQKIQTLYFRISTRNLQLPFTLWEPSAFAQYSNQETWGRGLYFGVIFVMIIYCGFIYLSLWDASYLYYVLFLFSYASVMLNLDGLILQFLLPESPDIARWIFYIGFTATIVFFLQFSQSFLKTKEYAPLTDRMISLLKIGVLIAFFLIFLDEDLFNATNVYSSLVAVLLGFIAGVFTWKNGYSPSRYYLMGWSLFLMGVLLFLLQREGFIPVSFLTENGMRIGSVTQIILISIGLADRINVLKREHIETQQELLEIQTQTNIELENKVALRTEELQHSLEVVQEARQQLEQQNVELLATNGKLEELNGTKELLLQKLSTLHDTHIQSAQQLIARFTQGQTLRETEESMQKIAKEIHYIDELLRPVTFLHRSEKAIKSKRVLLAETNKKQQIIAKMALGGTGVDLDIASNIEEGTTALETHVYDIICVNSELVELTSLATKENANIPIVFMTSDDAPAYLSILKAYPNISNIVSRNEEDRIFTLKNILTTISKLINHDLFSLEKYLNWGVEVREHKVINSTKREELIVEMEKYFNQLGIRRHILGKCSMVAEELLMNAIYDAPVDAQGKALYNHLSRKTIIELKPEEQGKFRYACDGILVALSVEDPFGAFDRDTILQYLQSCYEGKAGSLNKEKGGAGRGLFQIIETADLVVFNVKPKIRTEVIALFNLESHRSRADKTTSFHYFYG